MLSTNTNRAIFIGAAAVGLGAALWYLSRDPNEVKFDSKVHTIEALRKLIHELFVETATLYCQKLQIIKNL
jgi:hypothetical protein